MTSSPWFVPSAPGLVALAALCVAASVGCGTGDGGAGGSASLPDAAGDEDVTCTAPGCDGASRASQDASPSDGGGLSERGFTDGASAPDGARVDGGDAGPPCVTDDNCPHSGICLFAAVEGCSATGSCFPSPIVMGNLWHDGCGCDGTDVNTAVYGLPAGYLTAPLRHGGACTDADAPADAGSSP